MPERFTILILVLLVPLLLLAFYLLWQGDVLIPYPKAATNPIVRISDIPVKVMLADTQEERIRGLSGEMKLEATEGMLFVFPEDGRHGIWMKDMRFSIDVVWIDVEGKIVDFVANIAPESYPSVYEPSSPARYVLELPAKFTDLHNVKIGDAVILPNASVK